MSPDSRHVAAGRARAFGTAYADALRDYVEDPGEQRLRGAYELGREAVHADLGILDVVAAHQAALGVVLAADARPDALRRAATVAGDFLLESVATLEMVQRGYRETLEAAQDERRRAELVRSLSAFLADTALAGDTGGSQEEVLRLLCEQARELVPVACCLVTTGPAPQARAGAASSPAGEPPWQILVRWGDLTAVDEMIRAGHEPTRLSGAELGSLLRRRATGTGQWPEIRNWLGVPLTALDGRVTGAMHFVGRVRGEFTPLDEAVAVHLCQMAAAALERARIYEARRS